MTLRPALRAGFVLSVVAVTIAAGAVSPAGAAAPTESAVPPVAWAPCTEAPLAGLDCATYPVPLARDRPDGPTVSIALARRKATDVAQRIGTLFLNPGGPGGPGRRLAASTTVVPPAVMARYDLVGFDPRGIGASSPVQCFDTDEEVEALFNQISGVPLTRAQIDRTLRANAQYVEGCRRNMGPLLEHMGTINVAKDLDLLRQAVGDRRLHYVGFSYGTLIGATYANLFPRRVGRMIIDGNVDPDNRTNRRLFNKLERAGGFETALTGFLAACDAAGAACALAGASRGKFDAVRERLRQGPATLPDGSVVTIDDLTSFADQFLRNVTRFAPAAQMLQALYQALIQPGTVRARLDAPPLPKALPGPLLRPDAYSHNGDDAFSAVNCADARLPRTPRFYPAFASAFEAIHRTFGRAEAFSEVACATWPVVEDRYAGPWNRRTANVVLVINPTFDPATPYVMAQRMARQLGNARLLTLDGFGHTTNFSACIDDWYNRYLLAGAVPPAGTRCAQDQVPFPAP